MPERNWTMIELNLDKREMELYQRVLILSRTLFSQYLHQRAEKNSDEQNQYFNSVASNYILW